MLSVVPLTKLLLLNGTLSACQAGSRLNSSFHELLDQLV